MDIEMNQNILEPSICEACILRRRKRTSRRAVACYGFIAYNVLVLSVLFVTLWYITDRLHRTERTVAVLQKQNKPPEESPSIGVSSLTIKRDTEERIQNNRIDDGEQTVIRNVDRGLRSKRGTKRRPGKKKRCKYVSEDMEINNCLPVVQIEGTGGWGKDDKSNISNLWVTPSWVNPTDKQMRKYFDVSSVMKAGKIKVKEAGLYFIYAQMTLEEKSLGYHIKKEPQKTTVASCANNSNIKDEAELANPKAESANHMLKPCSTITVLRLEKNDMVYIEEIEGNTKVLYNSLSTVFGLIKIGI